MKFKILIALLSCIIYCPTFALHLTFHYNSSLLSIKNDTLENGVFKTVAWEGAYNEAVDVGTPELPAYHHVVKIADNVIVDTVKLTLSARNVGMLTHPIMPRQKNVSIGNKIEESQFIKNEGIYKTDEVFPQNCLLDYHVDNSREGNFLSLTIIPFQYNPIKNTYSVYSLAEVEILTHEENNRLQRTRRDIGIPYYEYVIITSSQLAPAFEPFAQWKRAKGYEVGIVTINDILNNPHLALGDTISNIADDAGKLRQYLTYSYNAVQTKYVLLGGDYSIIPIRFAYVPPDTIPTDFYYSELNCNWDGNNNGKYGEYSDYVDYGAEVYVGRLLCNSTDEIKNWTKKVLQYEINPGNGDYAYLGRALFSQTDHMQRNREAESIQQKLQGNISCTIYNEYPSYNAPNPTFPFGSDIITAINNTHYGLLGNFNHGGPLAYGVATKDNAGDGHDVHHGISAMDYYDTDDNLLYNDIPETNNGFDNLTNIVYPSVMYSTSCKNIPFDQDLNPIGTYNLGRVFTCRSNGGGPAYLGNTRDGYTSGNPTYWGPSITMYHYFLDSILTNLHVNHLGIAEAKSKFMYQHNYLRYSHNLLGCPEMSLYTRLPSTFDNLVVNYTHNNMTVSVGTADSIDCRICLSGNVDGIYRQFIYTDRSNVFFDIIPDSYTLVISKPNYIPYIQTNDTCLLQNITISDNRIYCSCNTFYIGSDITTIQPYGNVTIESGGDVTINVRDKVIIKNDFNVKLGGKLLIH